METRRLTVKLQSPATVTAENVRTRPLRSATFRLDRKTAVVTGGASGIGRAIVRCFAAAGASIRILDIDTKSAEKAAQEINAKRAESRHAERMARLVELSRGNTAIDTTCRYPVILADPPWRRPEGTSPPNCKIENHYPTMTTEAICALPVSALATEAAVLFLWSVAPNLPEALQVMAAWGFDYETSMVWVKHFIGPGYWVRSRHEFLLIGSRGDMPHPAPCARPDSVIEAPRREHSRKPDEAYEIIERMYPELPRIELFARQTRPGWAAWGNEIGAEKGFTSAT